MILRLASDQQIANELLRRADALDRKEHKESTREVRPEGAFGTRGDGFKTLTERQRHRQRLSARWDKMRLRAVRLRTAASELL